MNTTSLIPHPLDKILFVDIETTGVTPTLDALREESPDHAEVFESYREHFYKRFPEEVGNDIDVVFQNKSALTPEFSRVVAISFGWFDSAGEIKTHALSGNNEKALLQSATEVFNKAFGKGWVVCGHNIKVFDLPVIAKRCVINGLTPPEFCPRLSTKPWDMKAIDTKELWQFNSSTNISGLKLLCSSLGIESPKGGDVEGKDVHSFYWGKKGGEKTLSLISEYCTRDVVATARVVKKLSELS